MFTDNLFQFISLGAMPLFLVAIFYTLLVFVVQNIIFILNSPDKSLKNYYQNPLSWAWPLLVVLPISLIYISSHNLVTQLNNSLKLSNYLLKSFTGAYFLKNNLQYFIWLLSFGFALRAFFLPLSHKIWFNQSKPLRLMMVLIADFILSYLALVVIINLLSVSVSLYVYLGDNSLFYDFWHPDFNHGLLTVQYFLNYIFFVTVIFSLLPLVMIIPSIRKAQSLCPSWMYYLLTAIGLAIAGLLFILLVPQYNRRMENIRKTQLKQALKSIEQTSSGRSENEKLRAYIALKNLDDGYHPPFIFSSMIALRGISFLFELGSSTLAKKSLGNKKPPLLSSILKHAKGIVKDLS